MNIAELQQRLHHEGCNPHTYAIGQRGLASDAFCLVHDGHAWQVFYTERGTDQTPLFSSVDEADACAFFFKHITSLVHHHLVGFFRSQTAADDLCERLAQMGLRIKRDTIPYTSRDDWRHRIFVTGKDIFAAQESLGTLPQTD